MSENDRYHLVSIHGGHSGEFCHHAKNSLEEIINEYINKNFNWVGITEHAPPMDDSFLDPDHIESGLDAPYLFNVFTEYIKKARLLQKKYADRITIFVGVETEGYTGYKEFIPALRKEFTPDYIIGSLHHVNDLGFDFSKSQYEKTVEESGGHDKMYCSYFDEQYELIENIVPEVVGHFDLIRIFDPDYAQRIQKPHIWQRITRNLELIKKHDLILDFNLRALNKGASEPYITAPILKKALEIGIHVVPGDDSHAVNEAGLYTARGIGILRKIGFTTDFKTPVKRKP